MQNFGLKSRIFGGWGMRGGEIFRIKLKFWPPMILFVRNLQLFFGNLQLSAFLLFWPSMPLKSSPASQLVSGWKLRNRRSASLFWTLWFGNDVTFYDHFTQTNDACVCDICSSCLRVVKCAMCRSIVSLSSVPLHSTTATRWTTTASHVLWWISALRSAMTLAPQPAPCHHVSYATTYLEV